VPDALPVVLSAADWETLAKGIEQRARLADAALTDVYTDRRALSAGLIPPGLIYGGPSFAAHCAAWQRPPRQFLHIYEADVARTATGEWVLLSDRLEAPLGDGWLLANRIAASQAFADLFVDLGVRRLASHYAAFQDHLDQMMGWDGRLALLTAGDQDPVQRELRRDRVAVGLEVGRRDDGARGLDGRPDGGGRSDAKDVRGHGVENPGREDLEKRGEL